MRDLTHTEYADWVAGYVVHNFEDRDIRVYRDVQMGTSRNGAPHQVDLLVISQNTRRALAVECQYGVLEEADRQRMTEALEVLQKVRMPKCIVYGGEGYDAELQQELWEFGRAVRCEPEKDYEPRSTTRPLEQMLGMAFKWWDLVVGGKIPFAV